MALTPFSEIQKFAVQKLRLGLSDKLTYHHAQHTLDVLHQVEVIARLENIDDKESLLLLKVAALFHDIGFLDTYQDHEEKSCMIAEADLSTFNFSVAQKEIVYGLIRVTKVPQNPETHLQKIICDADLDYLGRPDFFEIGEGLFQEFLWQGVVKNELDWNQLQVRFLESHQYFTPSSKSRREPLKQEHLSVIRKKVDRLARQF